MRAIKLTLVLSLLLVALLWALADSRLWGASSPYTVRAALIQLSGLLALACMSLALVLAARPRWPERPLGGLDKMYRLHKWLGIGALFFSLLHWLFKNGFRPAIQWGWFEPGARPPRQPPVDVVDTFLHRWRHDAEALGEWAFYGVVVLVVLALLRFFPYRLFYKTHRIIAALFLVLVAHAVVLLDYGYWTQPVGWLAAALMAAGSVAAVLLLLRASNAGRQVWAKVVGLTHFPGVESLEIDLETSPGWPGHRPGQFVFAMSNASEGPHPYTIASAWKPHAARITIIAKALGDHTRRLPQTLKPGQAVRIEGPYGDFTFDDGMPRQIWVAGGIGITPFLARMDALADAKANADASANGNGNGNFHPATPPAIDLIHVTTEVDDAALARLRARAEAAGVRLHLLIRARDGRLNGERMRALVPAWREASLWFCGPSALGEALRKDLAAHGFPVARHFHFELYRMR